MNSNIPKESGNGEQRKKKTEANNKYNDRHNFKHINLLHYIL